MFDCQASGELARSAREDCVAILRAPMARPRARRRLGFVRTLTYIAYLPIAGRVPVYGRLVLALLRDPRIPTARKSVLAVAAAYMLSPVDLIPERLPIVGALDDVAVAVLALDVFLDAVDPAILDETLEDLGIDPEELEADRARVRRVVPAPIRAAAHRVPELLDGAATLIQRSGLDARLRERMPLGGTNPS
jgi:uncharacterized membrane protein YkvA (DUF1232 family)